MFSVGMVFIVVVVGKLFNVLSWRVGVVLKVFVGVEFVGVRS